MRSYFTGDSLNGVFIAFYLLFKTSKLEICKIIILPVVLYGCEM
jgi:hypothetical protein